MILKPFPIASKGPNLIVLYAARGVRGFGDGFAVIILPAYLSAIGFSPVEIGFVATSALFGTALLTLAVGFLAPRYDLRSLFLAGAALMICTGIAFPNFEHVAFVIVVAFFGRASGALVAAVPQGWTHGTGPASSSAMILSVISW